jgi:phenylpropionate dioxygenase-like ring-hydroxylating dioxygenase large terminal subunit
VILPLDVPKPSLSFSPTDREVLSHFWYPVAFSHEVTAAPVSATLLDEKLVVFRHSRGTTVTKDLCLHRGVPLSMGRVEGDELVCRYHGTRYGSDGTCRQTAVFPEGKQPCLTIYPSLERYGLIWTCLDPDAAPLLPDFQEWDDPDYVRVMPDSININAAAGRQLEGFLDVAHFAWIHTETFGDRTNPIVPRYDVSVQEHGLRADYASTVSNFTLEMRHRAPEDFLWWRIFEVTLPFSARLTVKFPEEGRLCILNACSPISARKTRVFVPIARNFDRDLPDEIVREFNHQVFAEDQEIVEAQCPEDLPIDLSEEVHIRADRTSIEYRKLLGRLGLGRLYTT